MTAIYIYTLPTISFGPETDDDTLNTLMARWCCTFTLKDDAPVFDNSNRSIDAMWSGISVVGDEVCAHLRPYNEETYEWDLDPIDVPLDHIANIEVL
jgi:hypothetical protein